MIGEMLNLTETFVTAASVVKPAIQPIIETVVMTTKDIEIFKILGDVLVPIFVECGKVVFYVNIAIASYQYMRSKTAEAKSKAINSTIGFALLHGAQVFIVLVDEIVGDIYESLL